MLPVQQAQAASWPRRTEKSRQRGRFGCGDGRRPERRRETTKLWGFVRYWFGLGATRKGWDRVEKKYRRSVAVFSVDLLGKKNYLFIFAVNIK